MKKEDIHLWDWTRIIIGTAPLNFMVEVFIRTFIIYLILIIILRFFGKKMGASYTIMEFAVIITLGAIVCVPMQIPDRGILPSTIILICVLVFYRIITKINARSSTIDKIVIGKTIMLVKNGVIMVNELKHAGISHEQLFSKIRGAKFQQLGQIKRVYLESTGLFSLYPLPKAKPGLSVIPVEDESMGNSMPGSNSCLVCRYCGNLEKNKENFDEDCNICGSNDWEQASTFSVVEEQEPAKI